MSHMVRCAFCKAKEAERSEYGVPICHDCFNIGKPESNRNNISSALVHDLTEAKVRFEANALEFNSIIDDIPSGLPHPDGTQRIQNASRKLATTRKRKERAYDRLDDYLCRGIVPEDLTSSE